MAEKATALLIVRAAHIAGLAQVIVVDHLCAPWVASTSWRGRGLPHRLLGCTLVGWVWMS
jgi:hypothetical protein